MNPNFCCIDCLQSEKNRRRDIAALHLVDVARHQPTHKKRRRCRRRRVSRLTIVNRNLLIASTAKRRTMIVILVVVVSNRRHLVNCRVIEAVARNHHPP